MAKTRRYFVRGGVAVRLDGEKTREPTLTVMKPSMCSSAFEGIANLFKIDAEDKAKATICSESTSRLILSSETFLDELPKLRVIVPCPVILERGGELVQVSGFDEPSGVLAANRAVEEIGLDDAKRTN